MNPETIDDETARHLRDSLVDNLASAGTIRTPAVENALRAVPRHRFLPGVPLREAYADAYVVTKKNADGRLVSSASQPTIVAAMLERAAVCPGRSVLEVGTATGYNAALLAELGAKVTSIEYDADLAAEAEQALKTSGYDTVRVVAGDGEFGVADGAPFDLIVVTVEAADIPPAWFGQLTTGGRLVVPLRLRGLARIVTFVREHGCLRSEAIDPGGFVAMQGAGAWPQHRVDLAEDARLYIDEDQAVDDAALAAATSAVTVWTGVVLRDGERVLPFLDLYLATNLPTYARMVANDALPGASSATWDAHGYAYTVIRSAGDGHEVGVRSVGDTAAHGSQLAERFAEHIRTWDATHRGGPPPVLRVYPKATAPNGPGVAIDKHHVRVITHW